MMDYYAKNFEILRDAVQSIDERVYVRLIEECYNVIENGGKIIASGLGKNVPICEKFVGTMNSYGIPANFLHTNTAVHGDLGIVKKEDLVILLSKSGNTSETIVLAHHLKMKKCKSWAITFDKLAKVCPLVDENLIMNLEHEGDQWNVVPNNSTTVYLIVLQGIAVELSKRLGITREQFGENHPGGNIGKVLGVKL